MIAILGLPVENLNKTEMEDIFQFLRII